MPLSSEPPRRRFRLPGLIVVAAALALAGCARRPPPPAPAPAAEAPVAQAMPAAFVAPAAIYDPPPPKLRFNIPAEAQAQPPSAPPQPKAQPPSAQPKAKAQPKAEAAFRPAPRKPGKPAACRPAKPAYDARGTASFYGRALHGDATASGEPFDMNALTAAHRTLAFGTRVRVTNLKNGRVVVLVINDRGPFADGRLIDVSRRAARELGFLEEDHLAPVRVEAVTGC